MKESTKGYLLGVLAAFLWGCNTVIARHLTSNVPGIAIAFWRLAFASVIIALFLKARGVQVDFKVKNKKWFVAIAVFGVALNFVLFNVGLQYTTASSAILLENTAPILVLVFLSLFLKERIRTIEVVAVALAFLGVAATVSSASKDALGTASLFGNVLELGAAATWALFLLGASKVFSKEKTSNERLLNLLKIFSVGALLLSPSLLFMPALAAADYAWLFALALFCTALAYFAWFEAASRLPAVTMALVFNLTIVFVFINSALFLGEEFPLATLLGAALIICGITLSKIGAAQKN